MEKKRDAFKSRTGFVIACIGSAVGMGNIWRFPYMVSDWGGMTFLLPYVFKSGTVHCFQVKQFPAFHYPFP